MQGREVLFRHSDPGHERQAEEVFTQVINNAFPAGTISVEDAVKQMTAAY